MNKAILMGRLTRDPEIRYTQGENSMCISNFSLAVDRPYKSKREGDPTADFISCVAFGKLAEHMEKYYKKGMKTCLEGRIQTRNYTNKEGQKVYVTEVIVDHMEFAESRSASGDGQGGYQPQQGSYGVPPQGGYQNPQGGYGAPQQGGYPPQQGYGAPQQGGYQGQGATNGFMNIPDGIDEELPFS